MKIKLPKGYGYDDTPISREKALELQRESFGHPLRELVRDPKLRVMSQSNYNGTQKIYYIRFHNLNRGRIRKARQVLERSDG